MGLDDDAPDLRSARVVVVGDEKGGAAVALIEGGRAGCDRFAEYHRRLAATEPVQAQS
jgi:hypothetical protein